MVDMGVSATYIMAQSRGKQDIVVAYLCAHSIGPDGDIREDRYSPETVWDYKASHDLPHLRATELGLLRLRDFGDHGLVPGKISPLDVIRLPRESFREAHFLVSPIAASLARDYKDIVLPYGNSSWEIRRGDDLLEVLDSTLTGAGWQFKVMDYQDWQKPDTFSPHI